MSKGATVQLVFGFEYAILLTIAFSAFFKFILHSIDLRSEDPWENKSMQVSCLITHVMVIYFRYMLYLDLIVSFSRLLLYATFICIMFKVRKPLKFIYSQILTSTTCLQKFSKTKPRSTRCLFSLCDRCILQSALSEKRFRTLCSPAVQSTSFIFTLMRLKKNSQMTVLVSFAAKRWSLAAG